MANLTGHLVRAAAKQFSSPKRLALAAAVGAGGARGSGLGALY
ncbi:hypothetical protein ACFRR7_34685 [Streptomyces sp. NPDC056909]